MNDKLLLLSTVMEIFGVSRVTIWKWTKDGYLEQRKLGCSHKVYITESSVNRLIATGERPEGETVGGEKHEN